MDRAAWLRERRQEAEERYSKLWAPLYWEEFGLYPNATHQEYLKEFIYLLPPGSRVLDAACGAGRYLPMLIEAGFDTLGVDQAQGMLARAHEKFPSVPLEKAGLQELSHLEEFEGAICMDAMEHICPEDWLIVLGNIHRALRPKGNFYFTVELAEEEEVRAAFDQGRQQGWPVVYGEWVNDDVYHFYPALEQVREWLLQTGFEVHREGEGDGYQHFIVRKI